VWTESTELTWYVAGCLTLLPLKKAVADIARRSVAYLLELTVGVTGRIVNVLRRAALLGLADRFCKIGLDQPRYVGVRISAVIGRTA